MFSAIFLFLIDNPVFLALVLIIFTVLAFKMVNYMIRKDRPKTAKTNVVIDKDAEMAKLEENLHQVVSDIFGTKQTTSIHELIAVLQSHRQIGIVRLKELVNEYPDLYKNLETHAKALPNGKQPDNIHNAIPALLGHVKSNAKMLAEANLDRDIAKNDANTIRAHSNRADEAHRAEMADLNTRLENMTDERNDYRTVAQNFEKQLLQNYKAQGDIALAAKENYEKLADIQLDDKASSEVKLMVERAKASARKAGVKEFTDNQAKLPQPVFQVVNGGNNNNRNQRNQSSTDNKPDDNKGGPKPDSEKKTA